MIISDDICLVPFRRFRPVFLADPANEPSFGDLRPAAYTGVVHHDTSSQSEHKTAHRVIVQVLALVIADV